MTTKRTAASNSQKPPDHQVNNVADVHMLKVKIHELVNHLPNYEEYKNFVVNTFEDESYEKRLTGLTKQQIKVRKAMSTLNAKYANFKSTYDKLMDDYRISESNSDFVKEMDTLENNKNITGLIQEMTEMQAILDEHLIDVEINMDLAERLKPSSREQVVSGSNELASERIHSQGNNTSVAPLRVPQFNGENYTEFIAGFDDLIHNSQSYSSNAKAAYFKNAIVGRAARCISGIPATGKNYQIMYDKVRVKFSRPASNQHNILRKLEILAPAKNNSRSMEDKVDEIEEILNQLNTANIGIDDSTNPIWHRLILRKFPEEIAGKLITQNHNNMEFSVRDLLDAIEDETFGISFREDAGFLTHESHHNDQHENMGIKRTNVPHKAQVEGKGDGSSIHRSSRYPCDLCDSEEHSSFTCTLSTGAKISSIKSRRLCWKCFKSNHHSANCHRQDCRCGGSHHYSICQLRNHSWNENNRNRNIQHSEGQQRSFRTNAQQNNSNPASRQSAANGQFNNPVVNRFQNNNSAANHFSAPQTQQSQRYGTPNRNYSEQNVPNGMNRGAANHAVILNEDQENIGAADFNTDEYLQVGHTAVESKNDLLISARFQSATLMTCEARIFDRLKNTYVKALLFFDSGSQQTLINENFAQRLGLEGESSMVSICGVNGVTEKFESKNLKLQLLDKLGSTLEFSAITKQFISKGFRSANLDNPDIQFLENSGIKIANSKIKGELVKPDILIGADNFTKLVCNRPAVILPSNLQVVDTVFGNCIFGVKENKRPPLEQQSTPELSINNAIFETDEDLSPSQMMKEMYEVESLGITHAGSPSTEKTAAYFQRYKKLISFEDNIVTAPLPLKDDISKLGSNYKMAYARLVSLVNLFTKNEDVKGWYMKKMEEYERDGIIQQVTDLAIGDTIVGTYIIPHHGVWTPEKENKPLRIVFDASSCQKGSISLNDAVMTGEVFVNKIANVILAARKSRYIIMCDIEAAFTQCRLPGEQLRLCCFLWLKDTNLPATKDNIVMFQFKRVPFGVNASPSILNMVIVAFLETQNNDMAREILKSLYVDNVQLYTDDKNEIWNKIKTSKELFKPISFNMREYVTNVSEINDEIPDIDKGKFGETKMLGVNYNTETDTLSAKISIKPELTCTRRTVVKQLHKVYDPIGLLAPSVIAMRILMREVISDTKHWNDRPPSDLETEWKVLIERFNNSEVKIPRYLGSEHKIAENQILWIFTDASIQAFAACAFIQDSKTCKVSNLLIGKAKMTPKVKIPLEDTIPKFELTSILLGVELAKTVIESLELSNCKLCIVNDSTAALSWVTLSKKLRKSCETIREKIINSVESLRSKNGIETEFFHCATGMNVADIGTRGVSPHELQDSDWVKSPKWLAKPFEELPIHPYEMKISESGTPTDNPEENQNHVTIKDVEKQGIFNFQHLKSAFRAKWIVAKHVNTLRNKVLARRTNLGNSLEMGSLWSKLSGGAVPTVNDLAIAETIIIRNEQINLSLEQMQVNYRQKDIFADQYGIIRFKSRLQNAELDIDAKNPIFLPNISDYLKLIIQEMHDQNGHIGREYLKMLVRQRFWVPKPTKAINLILRKCLQCRMSNSLPFKAPNMSQLPGDRLKKSRAFECTGVDCLGPFITTENDKVNVCLFTCLLVRAVHLEIVNNLSGGEFLKAFIRFSSRRGIPRLMRSDNGTNFVLGAKVIKSIFEEDETGESTMTYSKKRHIDWIFNPPSAPFMGGVWERLVSSVKSAFYKTVGRKIVSLSDLHTSMVKIEAIINSRPLTASDNDELINPLRPCDFICPGANLITPNFNFNIDDPSYEPDSLANIDDAKQMLSKVDKLLENFWFRFKNEYLIMLREQQRLILKQGKCSRLPTPRINEIVLIEDDLLPKYKWNVGKVVKLVRSQDGEIRSAISLLMDEQVLQTLHNMRELTMNQSAQINERLELLYEKISQIEMKLISLEARSSMRVCILCPLERNMDGHPSTRCPENPDTTSKVLRLTELSKCTKCLKDLHGSCDAKCVKCAGPHNILLCGQRESATPIKRARFQ